MRLRSDKLLFAWFCTGVFVAACSGPVRMDGGGDTPDAVQLDGSDVVDPDAPPPDVAPDVGCPMGQALCAGRCVNLQTDLSHCGGCGVSCAAGQVCNGGMCMTECTAPRMMCGMPAMCVDTSSDSSNCGACGNACSGGQTCAGGMCGCNAPSMMCGMPATCVNTATDAANCGRCGNVCAGGTVCNMGTCGCPAGQAFCGGRCIDIQSDAMNCGACGTICGPGLACSMGRCACTGTRMMCGGRCIDTASDPANCGACGNTCAGGTVCTMGSCVCATGTTLCSGACVNTMTDRNHCSGCGRACGAGNVCVGGTCSMGVDVMILIGNTGSNGVGVGNARMTLPMRLVAPLLALSGVHVGVAASAEFPVGPYGGTGDRPFRGVLEPSRDMAALGIAISNVMAAGGGDAADGGIEGLAPLVGLPVHPTSSPMVCSPGRVAGGCWRPGSRRIIVFVTDDIFHNGPDPNPMGMGLYQPYMGIMPAPATWPRFQPRLNPPGPYTAASTSTARTAR